MYSDANIVHIIIVIFSCICISHLNLMISELSNISYGAIYDW